MVHAIMVCFKRQLWFQNRILVSGRWRGLGLGGGCDGSWEVKPEIGFGYRRSDSLS